MFCLQVYQVDSTSTRWQHHHCVPWTDENVGAKKSIKRSGVNSCSNKVTVQTIWLVKVAG